MYLKITNPGICYPEAFTMLGVSTARGNKDKIGQFGSGAKMGILTCLRHHINPVIISGKMRVEFDSISRKMGDKEFKQVVAVIDGERKDLSFSLDYGAIDWNKIDYAVREFISNARDQGGCHLSIVDSIEQESQDSTSVYVEYIPPVKEYHENISKYFLEPGSFSTDDSSSQVYDNPNGIMRIYRKGVLCSEVSQDALFYYNINNLKIDESRNVNSFVARYQVAWALSKCTDRQFDRLLNAMLKGEACYENTLNAMDILERDEFKSNFNKAFYRAFPEYEITTKELYQYCLNKNGKVIPCDDRTFYILKECGVEIAKTEGGKIGVENGFMPIPTTTECRRLFNKIWNKVVKLGLHNNKEKPNLAMYAKPMSHGTQVNGYYDNGTVYIERNSGSPNVILEEIGHYVTDAKDCTRDFQDWAFNVAGCLIV